VLAIVDSLAAGEALDRAGRIGAGEHDFGEHALVIKLGGVGGDAEVVATESDAEVDGPHLMVHLVEVPERGDVGTELVGQRCSWHGRLPQSGIAKE